MIPAPVIDKNNRISVYGRCVPPAASHMIAFALLRLSLFFLDEPYAGFTPHTVTSMFPWVIAHYFIPVSFWFILVRVRYVLPFRVV